MIVKFNLWKLFQQDYIVNSKNINIILNNILFRINGLESIIGCYQHVLEDPPPIGSVITVKHFGYHQNGTLRHPFYWRIRFDLSWQDISPHCNKKLVCYFEKLSHF